MDSSKTEGFIDETAVGHVNQLKALEHVFRKAAEDDIPSEVSNFYLLLKELLWKLLMRKIFSIYLSGS